MTSIDTHTKSALSGNAPAQWPPKAHIVHRKDSPPKEGTIALCGVKLMGLDLDGMHTDVVCAECVKIAKVLIR